MRMAHLVGNVFSLSQTFIVNQITGLMDAGEQPDLYARFEQQASEVHDDVASYHLDRRSSSAGIPSNIFLRVLLAVPVVLVNLFRHPTYVIRALNGWKYGIQAWGTNLLYWVVCILNQNGGPVQYDVVHCHFGHRGNIGVFLRDIGVIEGKIVTTFYGRDVSEFPKTFGSNFYDDLFEKGDLFLVLSNHMKIQLMELGAPEDRIRVHSLGIDTERFKPSGSDSSTSRLSLLSVGRFVKKKGFEYALHAVDQLQKRKNLPDFEYVIAGDGPMRDTYETIIAQKNIDSVRLAGWKTQSDIIQLYDGADVFVAPSVTSENGDEEGTPTVIYEAMSMELPVVATRHAGIPEQVVDGKTGYLVDEHDVDGLCKKLNGLLRDADKRKRLGIHGRKRVCERFDIQGQVRELLAHYQSIQESS